MCFSIAIFGWIHSSSNRAASSFALFMFGIGICSLTYALEMVSISLSAMLFWSNFQYVGSALILPGFLSFTMIYTNHESWIDKKLNIFLSIEPLLILILVYTNPFHQLFQSQPQLQMINGQPVLNADHSVFFYINNLYILSATLLGMILIMLHINRLPDIFRKQASVLLIGILFPWTAALLAMFNINPIAPLELTIFSFFITITSLFLAIFRYGFLKTNPVARDVLIENMPDCVLVADRYDRVIDINLAAQQTLGIKSHLALGRFINQVFDDSHSILTQTKNGKKKHGRLISIKTNSGIREFEVRVSPLNDGHNRINGRLYVLHDITDRNNEEKILEESEAFHRSVVELAYDGIGIIDRKKVLYVNNCMCDILGLSEKDIVGKPLAEFIPKNYAPQLMSKIQKQLDGKSQKKIYESLLLHSSGKTIPVEIITKPIRQDDSNNILVIVRDITERKLSEAKLQHLAITDDLTGCFNRRHFFSLAQKEIERTRRFHLEMSIILLDLDLFKNINDQFGHIIGDQVLQFVANQCNINLREWDLLARYGGEEFIILLPDTPIQNARQTAERLRSVVEESVVTTQSRPINVTISLGVAGFTHEDNLSLEILLDRADKALYNAKNKGRNCVQVWSPMCPEII